MAELTPEATDFLLAASRDNGLELIRVRSENIAGLSTRSHTFWYDDPWVSSDVLLMLLGHLSPAERGLEIGEGDAGARYWTFPPTYPERLEKVMQGLRDNPAAVALVNRPVAAGAAAAPEAAYP